MFNIPVLFLVFNRPDTTAQVFEAIRRIKPQQLFIAADGPRTNRPDDIEKCKQVKELVIDGIDWNCEVKTLFRENNLGCGKGVSTAITWFFEHVEQGIILEDDCLPAPDFSKYCSLLLNKYKDESQIMHISGHNPIPDFEPAEQLIYSKYSFIWGWATWARAWKHHSFAMQDWENSMIKKKVKSKCMSKQEWEYWELHFDKYYKQRIHGANTWDYQWQFTLFIKNGISVVPAKSLISNIGIGHPEATHTTSQVKIDIIKENTFDFNKSINDKNINKAFDARVFNEIFAQWLPKFNAKVFIYENMYKYLPLTFRDYLARIKTLKSK